MRLEKIINKFQGRKGTPLGVTHDYSVLLPLIQVNNKLHILFEVRSTALKTQPGEISFPGGLVENGENYTEASVRETHEELNIPKDKIKIIGELDYMNSPYNFMLHAYCGILEGINMEDIVPNKEEVDHIFTVPIEFFVQNKPICHNIELTTSVTEGFPYHLIQNGEKYKWRKGKYPVYFYVYNEYVIWGITARIVKNFIDILNSL